MNSRERFLATMSGGHPDRPPLFPEGIRDEVLREWRKQGMPRRKRLEDLFHYDRFDELLPDIYPKPALTDWSDKPKALRALRQRLDPDDHRRMPTGWKRGISVWKGRDFPLFLRIHQGLFLSLGIEDWRRFTEAIQLLVDDPPFVHDVLAVQAEFAARLAENILRQIDVDALVFSEPIASAHGSLVSPSMYRQFLLASLAHVFEVLERYRVPVSIWRSYANPKVLIPKVAKTRFNALWLCETSPAFDYSALLGEFGSSLGLIGGIDSDVLYQSQQEIRQAIQAVLPLVASGRVIPLADGRVREDVPYQNYAFYRGLLEEYIIGA